MAVCLAAPLPAKCQQPEQSENTPPATAAVVQEQEAPPQILQVTRVQVDRLAGGETADQIRDMIISSLHATGLFAITENPERADAFLRGSAEDLVFTDTFSYNESLNARAALSGGTSSTSRYSGSRGSASASAGETDSVRTAERKHEASAAVRLVNKDGDVIWSTTQESTGSKFRGASADVAFRIARELAEDYEQARKSRSTHSASQ